MNFLLGFATGTFLNVLAAGPYFDFVTTMFLGFGIVMEFPILLFALSRVNIVTSVRLAAARRYVILGIVIFAAVATPGGDLVSPAALTPDDVRAVRGHGVVHPPDGTLITPSRAFARR